MKYSDLRLRWFQMCWDNQFAVFIVWLKKYENPSSKIKNTKEKLSFVRAEMPLELRSPRFGE